MSGIYFQPILQPSNNKKEKSSKIKSLLREVFRFSYVFIPPDYWVNVERKFEKKLIFPMHLQRGTKCILEEILHLIIGARRLSDKLSVNEKKKKTSHHS